MPCCSALCCCWLGRVGGAEGALGAPACASCPACPLPATVPLALPWRREALELAGVQPEALQAELVARQRAKQQRLYSGHAASQAHSPSAAAAPAARGASSAAAAASGTDPTTPTAGPLPREAEPAADASPPGGVLPGAQPAAAEPERGSAEWLAAQAAYEDAHLGQFERIMPPEDPALVRGRLRLFGWRLAWGHAALCWRLHGWGGARVAQPLKASPCTDVFPPSFKVQAAHYEELLQGALQVFYRCTMQGRNQQLLNSIK